MTSKRKAEPEFHQLAKCSRVEEVLTRGNNALMKLNEIGIKGLKWNFEQINAMFPQRFRATSLFTEPFTGLHNVIPTGVVFCAEGSNKSSCRHDIASQIMDRLSDKNTIDKVQPMSSVMPLEKEVLIKTPTNVVTEINRAEQSLMLLNEKVPDIDYNLSISDDGFCCVVSYKDTLIKGTGSSKKAAKRSVASQILKTYFNYVFTEDGVFHSPIIDTPMTNETDNLPLNRRTKFSNQIQAMIKNGYEKLVSALDIKNEKRRVLAGIVISRKLEDVFPEYKVEECRGMMPDINDPLQFYALTGWTVNPDDAGEILKLVTVSSGSKCLSGHEVNSLGVFINDSHAEVITKRALQYFIHRTIYRLINGVHPVPSDPLFGSDILEVYAADNPFTYKLKENVKFHLYVSSSPCGDSRLLFPQTVSNNATQHAVNTEYNDPTRSNLGLLRTKIESGEGTVPLKLNRLETWDGVLESERVSIMSCSDKVCTWNVLGLQGALLSNMLSEPIYLDSITIGSLFQWDHSQRALCDRAQGVINHSDWMLNKPICVNVAQNDPDIEQGELETCSNSDRLFHVNTPYLLTVTDQDERCPGNGSDFSGNWIVGEKSFEIVTTVSGLTTANCASRLSKRSLFVSFLGIFKWLPFICPDDGVVYYDELKKSVNYPDHALGAVKYQQKKMVLLHFFQRQNLGSWIKKSIEQNRFSLRI